MVSSGSLKWLLVVLLPVWQEVMQVVQKKKTTKHFYNLSVFLPFYELGEKYFNLKLVSWGGKFMFL